MTVTTRATVDKRLFNQLVSTGPAIFRFPTDWLANFKLSSLGTQTSEETMLRKNDLPAKPDVQRAVDQMLKSDANFDRYENRSAHRKHLVRAVEIEFRETDMIVHAFSRNISAAGMGVVSLEQIETDALAVLKIASLEGEDTQILSECRWCKPFGPKWFLSGWQFIGLKKRQ